MKRNEWTVDRLVRLSIAMLAIVWWYFWLSGTLQMVLYVIGIATLFTGIVWFCWLYPLLKISTCERKQTNGKIMILWVISIIILWWIFAFASNFFSRKFFLEDFARMNDSYKQLLFNTGKDKRTESISYYDKLIPAYREFQNKYTNYKPYVLRNDIQFDIDLVEIALILDNLKDAIYSGNLPATHKELEAVRPIFQDIFKRNGFSVVAVTLVDFHDIMETMIAWADDKDIQKIITTYPIADTKLKEVEVELNDEGIKTIRKNLDILLEMAKNNQLDSLAKQWADLKASFVKVYLIKG